MASLDGDQRRRARLRNILQSLALVVGIGVITALSAYTLFGVDGIVWGLILIGIFIAIGPRIAPETIMAMFQARPLDRASGSNILQIVKTLAERAGLHTVPRVYIIPSSTLNAFAVGTPAHYALGVTEGLLRRLNLREFAGVVAHEITHIRNNDIWVMSLADMLSRLTRTMSFVAVFLFFLSLPAALLVGTPVPWAAILLLYLAPAFSSLLQLALSRSREFDADLGGAMLTGDPEGLASALTKLEHYQGRVWEDILMPGRRIPVPSVLRTHPQTSERIARLMALKKPSAPVFSFPDMHAHASAFAQSQRRPRFHMSGLWF